MAERWRVEQLGEKPAYTWEQACVRYLREKAHKKSLNDDKCFIKYFTGFFAGRELRSIKRDEVLSAVSQLTYDRAGPFGRSKRKGESVSGSRMNRYLTFAATLFRLAANEWEWIDRVLTFKKKKEANKRIRWITKQEASRLLSELAPHLQAIVKFALSTGLRHGNIVGLQWSQVNLVQKMAWVHPEDAKAGKAIGIPLNQSALDALISQVGKNPKWVFTFRGRPVKTAAADGFRNGLRKSGIENFRFHDLRHTWASWLVQSGVPLHIIQELGGWQSFEMVKRYAHLAPEHLREHIEKVDGLLDSGTNTTHLQRCEVYEEEKKKALQCAVP